MKYGEIIARASQLAQGVAGAPPEQVDREMTAEAIYPHAVRAVYRRHAATGRHLENLSFEHNIEIVNGQGVMPDEVLREYMDRSFLPREQFASRLPFEDYQRYRFDNQLKYYSDRGSKLFYSGDVPKVIEPNLDEEGEALVYSATEGSETITGDASTAQIGDRVYLLDDTNGLVAHAVLASINGTTDFTIQGFALVDTAEDRTAVFTDGQDDEIVRESFDVETTEDSNVASSQDSAFTSEDVGRRLRVYEHETTTVVVDAIILSVSADGVEATLGAKAIADAVSADAAILYAPLILQAIGIPALPSDLCTGLDLVDEVAEDVVAMIAAVLRGESRINAWAELGGVGSE